MADQAPTPMVHSDHAGTLNALDDMQKSLAYAARRPVLAAAERIIVDLERRCATLTAELAAARQERDEANGHAKQLSDELFKVVRPALEHAEERAEKAARRLAIRSMNCHLNADMKCEALVEAERTAEQARARAMRYEWLTETFPDEITRLVHNRHRHGPTSSNVHEAIDAALSAQSRPEGKE